jgi:hypothetical protein
MQNLFGTRLALRIVGDARYNENKTRFSEQLMIQTAGSFRESDECQSAEEIFVKLQYI